MLLFNIECDMMVFLIDMDDIIVDGNNVSLIKSMINKLNEVFALKGLGNLNCVLGIKVIRETLNTLVVQSVMSLNFTRAPLLV